MKSTKKIRKLYLKVFYNVKIFYIVLKSGNFGKVKIRVLRKLILFYKDNTNIIFSYTKFKVSEVNLYCDIFFKITNVKIFYKELGVEGYAFLYLSVGNVDDILDTYIKAYNMYDISKTITKIEELTKNRSLAIVGNGMYKEHCGAEIDSKDVVVRFNSFKTKGYSEHVGSKTDIWFFGAFVNDQNSIETLSKEIDFNSLKMIILKDSFFNFIKSRDSIIYKRINYFINNHSDKLYFLGSNIDNNIYSKNFITFIGKSREEEILKGKTDFFNKFKSGTMFLSVLKYLNRLDFNSLYGFTITTNNFENNELHYYDKNIVKSMDEKNQNHDINTEQFILNSWKKEWEKEVNITEMINK